MSWRSHTGQVWVGNARNEDVFRGFFDEDHSRFSIDDCDDSPVSTFAASQDQTFIDHDFCEGSVKKDKEPFSEWLLLASGWGADWAGRVHARMDEAGIENANCYFMVLLDQPHSDNKLVIPDTVEVYRQVGSPKNIDTEDLKMAYIGEISWSFWNGPPESLPKGPAPDPVLPSPAEVMPNFSQMAVQLDLKAPSLTTRIKNIFRSGE